MISALDGGQWSASLPDRFSPKGRVPLPIVLDAGWALEQVWTLWRREKLTVEGGALTQTHEGFRFEIWILCYLQIKMEILTIYGIL
jgi:hypothetical protein